MSQAGAGPRLNPRLVVAIAALAVSFSSIIARYSQAPALVTATLRLVCTVALLTPVVLWRHRAELRRITLRDLGLCGAAGVFLALHFWSWFAGLKLTTVAAATALVNTSVIFTALGFAIFLKGRIPRLGVAAIGITFCGGLAIALGSGGGSGELTGNFLALLSAIFLSSYLLIGRVQRGHLSNNVYTWLVYTACMLTLLCASAATGTRLTGWGGREWLVALALALICTFLGHSLFNWCLAYLTPSFIAAVEQTEPIISAIFAFILFGEMPAPLQILGAAVVLGGIFLYILAENRAARARPH